MIDGVPNVGPLVGLLQPVFKLLSKLLGDGKGHILSKGMLAKLLGGLSGDCLGLRSPTDDANATIEDIVDPGQFSRPLSFYRNTG